MQKILTKILALIWLASCTSSKHISKQHTASDSTDVTRDAIQTINLTTSTLVSQTHTEVEVPEKPFDDLAEVEDSCQVVFTDPVFTATLTTDPITHKKKLTGSMRPFTLPVDMSSTLTTNSATKTKALDTGTVEVKKESDSYLKDKDHDGPNWTLIILTLAGAGIAIAGLKLGWFVGWKTKDEDKKAT